jgi:hypothetical protein
MSLVMCLVYAAGLALPGITSAQRLSTGNWTTVAPNVSTAAWSPAQIGAFIDSVDDFQWQQSKMDFPTRVAEFGFFDLAGNGKLELVALDNGDRGRTLIIVVFRKASAFGVDYLDTPGVRSLKSLVVTARPGPLRQLLVPQTLSSHFGQRAPPGIWTMIYTWSGSKLVDSTASYLDYYRGTIEPALRQVMLDRQKQGPNTPEALVAKVEFDKVRRVTGEDPQAGLNDALIWASSANPLHRLFAVAVIDDIGAPGTRATLESLTDDEDNGVSTEAKVMLQHWTSRTSH